MRLLAVMYLSQYAVQFCIYYVSCEDEVAWKAMKTILVPTLSVYNSTFSPALQVKYETLKASMEPTFSVFFKRYDS